MVNTYYKIYGLNATIFPVLVMYIVQVYILIGKTVSPKSAKFTLSTQLLTIYGGVSQSRDFVHVLSVVQAIELAF